MDRHNKDGRNLPRIRSAFTMFEAMVLIVILGITAVAIGRSLLTLSNSAVQNDAMLQINDKLLSQLEYLRANYSTLGIGKTTQTIAINGSNYSLVSDIEQADPGPGDQSTFLSLQVTIGNNTMSTCVSK